MTTTMRTAAGLCVNLRVPGGDGTPLAVDVRLPPEADWPVPVVVTRTPYGRSAHLAEASGWAGHGFGYVVQDVRGRYDSEGCWRPYLDERADGAALVDWVLAQPWCDGQLVAYGGSYSGYTAWALAVERPDAVAAVVSLGPSMGLHRTKFEPSGILRLAEHAYWWLERADARTSRDGLVRLVHSRQPDVLDHLPVYELPERLGAVLPHWGDVLRTGTAPGPQALTDEELARLPAAAFHVGGWYDLLVSETLGHWELVGSAVRPRPPRRLVVGPWGHDLAFATTTRVGGRDHGPRSRYDFAAACVAWLRAVLAQPPAATSEAVGTAVASSPQPASALLPRAASTARRSGVEVFVRGADAWTSGTCWPPRGGTESVRHARADGSLSVEEAGPAGARSFRYDPRDPFPSVVAGTDRRALLGRPDAVRYLTEPLAQPVTVLGAGRVELTALTDAPDADWVVRVLAWLPEGPVHEVAYGTASWPAGPGGSTVTGQIPLSGAAERVPAGSRLILEITSSDHPNLARNLGTGRDRYTTTTTHVCDQTVLSGPGPRGTTLVLLTQTQTTPADRGRGAFTLTADAASDDAGTAAGPPSAPVERVGAWATSAGGQAS
ncbi:CocE/NonD family hydrolase [Pseudofrankia sp. DC12]|uniref:CocE/NonD family hydrolase n=1 Tax=Pseudofrankia sp. DC12 TaxID=683315 RepID=UPI0006992370|nr:CocE/NonD family hydrolase [Pseudofrankia sp. DC12]